MFTKDLIAVSVPPRRRRGRSLLGMAALAGATLATGCSDSSGGSDATTEPGGSAFALCELDEVRRVSGGPTLEEVLTGDDPSIADALIAIGLFVDVREEVVVELDTYGPGASAIQRRNNAHVAAGKDVPPGEEVAFPDVEPTDEEMTSIRAADEFIAEGGCDRNETEAAS
jgi:hypothetical protein